MEGDHSGTAGATHETMKILYFSGHSIHEYDDYRLFLELGHEVFSLSGAYVNPLSPGDTARPTIPGGRFYPELYKHSLQCSKENPHEELIEWCDLIYIQHFGAKWIPPLWEMAKKHKKRVLWRGAGQSVRSVEEALRPYREDGMLIVRYSPRERMIPGYIGEDAIIRFYKDPDEWRNWNGREERVITICQSIRGRGVHCNWEAFDRATEGLPRKVYGRGNDDLGDLWGGELSYDDLRKVYQNNRVYLYTGTMPAPVTLNFIESFMTGIPVVSIGPKLGNPPYEPEQKTFEIQDIIVSGKNGFISDNIEELRGYIKMLLDDHELAKRIGVEGRKMAIKHFGKQKIKAEWGRFFDSL